jgi:hypothetical protein
MNLQKILDCTKDIMEKKRPEYTLKVSILSVLRSELVML